MKRTTTAAFKSDGCRHDQEWCVGDLVQSIKYPELIYMLIPQDFQRKTTALPMTVNQSSLSGVVVMSAHKKDSDGDYLPELGSVHPGFDPKYFRRYSGRVTLYTKADGR